MQQVKVINYHIVPHTGFYPSKVHNLAVEFVYHITRYMSPYVLDATILAYHIMPFSLIKIDYAPVFHDKLDHFLLFRLKFAHILLLLFVYFDGKGDVFEYVVLDSVVLLSEVG